MAIDIKNATFVKGVRGTDPIFDDPYPHVAFVGRSNVGKSSTMNSVLGTTHLVKASATPGKTREINFFFVNNTHYFVDLPGYGFARISKTDAEKLRKMLIWYLVDAPRRPERVVLILDAAVGLTELDQDMLDLLHEENHQAIIVANKIDKLNQKEQAHALRALEEHVAPYPVVPFSAKKHRGVQKLREAIFT